MKPSTRSSLEEKTKGRAVVQEQKQLLIRRLKSDQIIRYIPLILFAIAIIILGLIVPHFLTMRNSINVLRQASALGFMAIGITAVLIGGGIDLSIPSLMA